MKTYDLKLNADQIKTLLAGLGELPTKFGMPVSLEINRQLLDQERREAEANRAAEAASKPAAEETAHEANPQMQSPKPNGHLGHFAASAPTG